MTAVHAMQSEMELRMRLRLWVSTFHTMILLLCMMGLMGALQTIPSVAVMTLAITRSAGKLLELFIAVGTVTFCFAMILYVGTLSDERLSTLPLLSVYMLRGVITGAHLKKHKRRSCWH